ncbi:MAG: helix-turn-helix domain-containing protein [Burkholderiales bacterium]|nr:helix-turn-helix domain-containing protein [Burkholderiales bacterium]
MANSRQPPAVPTRTILVVVFEDFLLLDAAGPIQVFATANDEAVTWGDGGPRYRIRAVSVPGGPIRSSSGVTLGTERLPVAARARGATIIVAGGPGVHSDQGRGRLVEWVRKAAAAAERTCSVCTGAFIVARTGLMDGGEAVTHWRDVADFRREFPGVTVHADALFVRSGRVHSSAGVTAGIDLCLSLLEQDQGREFALAVAKRLVVHSKRPGGQLQFSSELLAQSAPASSFDELVRKLKDKPAVPWSIERMAGAVHMSTRSFHRKFVEALGVSPLQYLANIRLEVACALIERERATLKSISRQAGFGSEVNMKNAFTRRLGVTPTEYLARFRG